MNHTIETEEQLRAIIGPDFPGTEQKVLPALDHHAKDFIGKCPFIVMSTADRNGRADTSPKGDMPGFILVEDDTTLVIPDRPGNRLVYGHKNILENPRIGLLFIIPGTPETLRVNGTAQLSVDPRLLDRLEARGRPALVATRVFIEECFFHCAKAFIRSKLWQPDSWPNKQRISFGEMLAEKAGTSAETAKASDEEIAADYRDNL